MKRLALILAIGCLLPAATDAQTIYPWTLLANQWDHPRVENVSSNALESIIPFCPGLCPVPTNGLFQGGTVYLPRTPNGDSPAYFSFQADEQIVSSNFFNTFTNAQWEWNTLEPVSLDGWGSDINPLEWLFPNMIWHCGDGMMIQSDLAYDYFMNLTNSPAQPHIPSGRKVHIPPGQAALLGAESPTNGTYEIVVGMPPVEGSQVYRLNPYGYIGHFGPPDYNVYTFSHGGWSPDPPVLNIGEAAWFTAPTNFLDMFVNGNELTLSWTTNLPGYTLQTSTSIANSNSWSTLNSLPVTNGAVQSVILPISKTENRFFRLKQ